MPHISESQFKDRFLSVVLKGSFLPNKQLDRYIIYISAVLGFNSDKQYTEQEVNAVLHNWTDRFGENIGLDHVTLRRALVDMGYFKRDDAGSSYSLDLADKPYTFDEAIGSLDLEELISQAKRDREERKQRYIKRV